MPADHTGTLGCELADPIGILGFMPADPTGAVAYVREADWVPGFVEKDYF